MRRFVFLIVGLLFSFGALAQTGTESRPAATLLPEVTMYATDWCPFCEKARRYFKKNGIDYVEHDIEKSVTAMAEYRRLGGRGIPLILVGDKRVMGFSEANMDQVLKAAGY